MTWTYRECVVIIAAAFRSPGSFRPVIKIHRNSRDPPTALTTGHTFLTAELALAIGQEMARNWIDGHFERGANHLHGVGKKKQKVPD